VSQSSQIDDPFHARDPACVGEIRRRLTIPRLEIASGAHRVDQVVGHIDAAYSTRQAGGVQHVSAHTFGASALEGRQPPGIAGHRAHRVAFRQQLTDQSSTDVPGRSRNKDRGAFWQLVHSVRLHRVACDAIPRQFKSRELWRHQRRIIATARLSRWPNTLDETPLIDYRNAAYC
jgi:hypothetical protein